MEHNHNSPNPLDKIRSNVPDDTFNQQNQQQAKRDIKGLFGEKAKLSFHNTSALYVSALGKIMLGIIGATLLIRAFHLLSPISWQWLPQDNLDKIDNIILAVLAGLLARFFPTGKE